MVTSIREREKYMKTMYVIIIRERGTPDAQFEGVFDNEEMANAAYEEIREDEGYDMDDVSIVEMPLNEAKTVYL
jgi:hypothetical protein